MLETSIDGARAVLINITGGPDTSIIDINEAATIITQEADPEANIIFGAGIDDNLTDEVHITVIATVFEAPAQKPDPRVETAGYARAEERKPLLSDEEQVSPIFGTARTAVEPIINERPAQAAPQTQRPAAPQQNAPRPRAYQDEPDPRTRNRRGFTPDVPVYLSDRTEQVVAEIQIRTIAMDFWASLEHDVHYKVDKTKLPEGINEEMLACADRIAEIDRQMQNMYMRIKAAEE